MILDTASRLCLLSLVTFAMIPVAASLVGCGPSASHIHPVEGRFVASDGGDLAPLAGHIVEARLASDPLVRASGEIEPDGAFRLETLYQGEIVEGAPEGAHEVRILLSDDDPVRRQSSKAALDPAMLEFETSSLRIESPPPSDPQLEVHLKR